MQEKFITGWAELEKKFLPAYVWNSDPLTFWRERILFFICFLAAVIGPIALIPSIWISYREGLWDVIVLDCGAYAVAVGILFKREWPLKIRTGILSLVLYALGMCLLLFLGPVGAGYIWLFSASVIISAIVGMRAALWTLILNTFVFLIVAVFIMFDRLPWMMQYDSVLEKWLVMSVNFLLADAFVTLTTAMMLNGLSQALSGEQNSKKSLQESEERFRAISEYSHHAICIVDKEAKITWVNDCMLEISGYSREQILGSASFLDFLAPEFSEFVTHNFQVFLNGGPYQHHYQFMIIRSDGQKRLLEKYMTHYADRYGRRHLIISMMDVTDQQRAKEAIVSSEKKFRQLFNGIGDALFVHNGPLGSLSGRFIEVNDMACRSLGYQREELLEIIPASIYMPDAETHLRQKMADSPSKESISWESVHVTKDGREIPVEITSQVFELNGELVVLSMARDISERKQAQVEKTKLEFQLLQAQKMEAIGSLAGGIAHDLNNILFPISGLSEMLLEEIPPDIPTYSKINQIHRSAMRGSDLVKQILAFSRQSNIQKLPMRIQSVVKEVLKLFRATIPQQIKLTSNIQPDCGSIFADPTQIHQVLMNLITNAYHAVEQNGGSIHVSLKESTFEKKDAAHLSAESGRYACLTVTDTGTGIDRTVIDRIFDPYFTTKEQGKGTGLGLSVVHGIVKESGGDIWVDSEFGKGTTIDVYFPRIEITGNRQAIATYRKNPTGSERILLIDDELPIADMVQKMLQKLGYAVMVQTDSLEAFSLFKASPDRFDLVISDRGMPDMSGDRLAAELLAIRPEIPIIICTGFCDEQDEQRVRNMGVKDFLMKPVKIGDLAAMVRNVLDRK
jgi:PAS domain S-box-containing protein